MNGNGIARHYDRLATLERFRLVVAAYARDDDVEAERLTTSCPRENYSIPEAAFRDRLELAREFVLALLVELAPIKARLEVLRGIRPLASHLFTMATDEACFALYTSLPPKHRCSAVNLVEQSASAPKERLLAMLEQIERELTAHATAVAHGFAAFARDELELEPTTLIAAFAPAITHFEVLLAEQPNAEWAAGFHAILTGMWRWRLGLEPDPPSEVALPVNW